MYEIDGTLPKLALTKAQVQRLFNSFGTHKVRRDGYELSLVVWDEAMLYIITPNTEVKPVFFPARHTRHIYAFRNWLVRNGITIL